MFNMFYLILILLSLGQPADNALTPYSLKYEVLTDGKVSGELISTLSVSTPDQFVLSETTTGTKGMASFLGFKREEITRFSTQPSMTAQSYRMQQKVAFKKRQSNYRIDDQSQAIIGEHKGQQWRVDNNQPVISTSLLMLALAVDACAGKQTMSYQVVVPNAVKTYRFEVQESTPDTIKVARIHDKKTAISWLDRHNQCLPLKSVYANGKGKVIETRLLTDN